MSTRKNQTPLRIAYIINSVEGGGAALPIPSIADVLRRGGVEIKIFALERRDGRAIPPLQAAGLDVAICPVPKSAHGAALFWLMRSIAEWGPTHLWTSLTRATLLGQLVGLFRRLPVISWQHAAYLKPGNRRLLAATNRLSNLWIGDSASVTKLTEERLNVTPERLLTWPIFRSDPDVLRVPATTRQATLRIGSLGRLHFVKGYDVLIDALALLRETAEQIEVRIGGDGALREALAKQAHKAGLSCVRFVGYVEDTAAFMASCNLYVQPSRSEGFCIAAHEAMQAGLPVIASAVGELQHSIAHGTTGYLVPPGDAEALARAIQIALINQASLANMGTTARLFVHERFGPAAFEAAGAAVLNRIRMIA
jgi:glycosyltransferase involved in cell wall biosynthesis